MIGRASGCIGWVDVREMIVVKIRRIRRWGIFVWADTTLGVGSTRIRSIGTEFNIYCKYLYCSNPLAPRVESEDYAVYCCEYPALPGKSIKVIL